MRTVTAMLAAALIGACQATPENADGQLSRVSAQDLAIMMRDDPAKAMAVLWESLKLQDHNEVTKWCLHQIGTAEAEPCRDFNVEHSATLLDFTGFGPPEELVSFLLGDQPSPSGADLAFALGPVFDKQFAGGFAKRMGRTLYAMRVRAEQVRRAAGDSVDPDRSR